MLARQSSALHNALYQKLVSPVFVSPNLTRVAEPKQKKSPQNCLDKLEPQRDLLLFSQTFLEYENKIAVAMR